MSDTYRRIARIEGIDLTTGAFPMTLATEGEASDGHILSIKGGQIPERMPLLSAHWNDPNAQLGSVTDPQKALKDSPPRLRAVGHIEMTGEGTPAEIRRDLAHMIDKGHVTGMSIRWDEIPGKTIRRINLPSDHPYYVDAEKEKGPARWGLFFEEWRGLEGSIVPVGADPGALIGRANETTGEVASFWRAMAEAVTEDEPFIEIPEEDDRPLVRVEIPEDESDEAKIAASLAALRIDAADCREAGASVADLINAVVDTTDEDFNAIDIGGQTFFLPASVAVQLDERAEHEVAEDLQPEPAPEPVAETSADQRSPLALDISELMTPLDVKELAQVISDLLNQAEERQRQTVQELLDLATGKVA
jgi:hypothetical protein